MTTNPRLARLMRFFAIAAPPVIVLAFAACTLVGLRQSLLSRSALDQAHEVNLALQHLLVRMVDAETAQRGFLLTGDTAYLQPLQGVQTDVREETARLDSLLSGERRRRPLVSLSAAIAARLAVLDSTIQLRRQGPLPPDPPPTRAARGRALMDDVRRKVAGIQRVEDEVLARHQAAERFWSRLVITVLAAGAVVSAGVALVTNYQFARHAAELDESNQGLEEQNRLLEEQAVELEEASVAIRSKEDRFRRLIENCGEAIGVIGADGIVRYESPAIARMLGLEPQSLLGTPAAALVHPDDLPDAERVARELAAVPGAHATAEFRVLHADQSWHVLEAVAMNGLDDSAVAGVVVNARDVTVRRRTEEALRKTEEQLRQAAKMEAIGRLAGGIAHDFNNLLTVIGGNAALLSARLPDASDQEELGQIRDASDRAAALTRQLLLFSRRQVVQPRVVNPNDVVRGIEMMLRRLISERVLISLSLDERLRPVRLDPNQFEQVLMNLAVNASDAMPNGGRLIIETRNVEIPSSLLDPEQGGDERVPVALLAVSDTGVGMDAATKERVFEPFFTTKGPGKGTGLGLSTAYGIVHQAGGRIWLYSEVGRGTTFKIYLPFADGGPAAESAPSSRPFAAPTGHETVLLVEDEPAVRSFVEKTLAGAGYNVLTADGPDAALQIALHYSERIHLLLTDVVMPGQSGTALAEQLIRDRPGLVALFMSGYTDDALLDQAVLDHGVAFLEKPFTADQLTSKIREVLEGA